MHYGMTQKKYFESNINGIDQLNILKEFVLVWVNRREVIALWQFWITCDPVVLKGYFMKVFTSYMDIYFRLKNQM